MWRLFPYWLILFAAVCKILKRSQNIGIFRSVYYIFHCAQTISAKIIRDTLIFWCLVSTPSPSTPTGQCWEMTWNAGWIQNRLAFNIDRGVRGSLLVVQSVPTFLAEIVWKQWKNNVQKYKNVHKSKLHHRNLLKLGTKVTQYNTVNITQFQINSLFIILFIALISQYSKLLTYWSQSRINIMHVKVNSNLNLFQIFSFTHFNRS